TATRRSSSRKRERTRSAWQASCSDRRAACAMARSHSRCPSAACAIPRRRPPRRRAPLQAKTKRQRLSSATTKKRERFDDACFYLVDESCPRPHAFALGAEQPGPAGRAEAAGGAATGFGADRRAKNDDGRQDA